MKIYIGCGLTHVPRQLFAEYARFIHHTAQSLEAAHEVRYALRDSDPQLASKPQDERARLCYVWDRKMVEDAEVMVAEVSFPSTGLGLELQIAEARNTPLILCYRDWGTNRAKPVSYETPDRAQHDLQIGSGIVSLMVLGLPSVFEVIPYTTADDGAARIASTLARLDPSKAAPID